MSPRFFFAASSAVLGITVASAGCGRSGLGVDDLIDTVEPINTQDAGPDARLGAGCESASDCVAAKPGCETASCVANRCAYAAIDEDHDGFLPSRCGGNDCDDTSAAVNPKAAEICGNRRDDDCNSKTDCADTACAEAKECKQCGTREICNNGKDDNCDNRSDCDDPQCVFDAACKCKGPERCDNGVDDDCNGFSDCDDPSCRNDAQCKCRNTPENCGDGKDNDCDNLVDCADPQCASAFQCSCNGRPPRTEDCTNKIDDDCDGKADCADSQCIANAACKKCTTEDCSNGIDDSCDGLVDCADSSCRFAANCAPKTELCNNAIDDDLNGLTDCFDPACKNTDVCKERKEACVTAQPITASGSFTGDTGGYVNVQTASCGGAAGEAVYALTLKAPSRVVIDTKGSQFDTALYVRTGACNQGLEIGCDDDSAGSWDSKLEFTLLYPGTYFIFVDGFTVDAQRGPDEGKYVLNVDITPNPKEVCGNGKDDDGDHLADCADSDCAKDAKCANCKPEIGVKACTDGLDNDCDGLTDSADRDCRANDAYPTEVCNGKDDNGNKIVDEFACACTKSSDCAKGEICFTDTVWACSKPCSQFNGDICPFAAPGSVCSTQTSQCQYRD
jgi:hypothetical protein